MNQQESNNTSPEILPDELPDKVDKLHNAFDAGDIPHAFGGAIALGFHKRPRATTDIDVNIFLPPEQQQRVISTLGELFTIPDPAKLEAEIAAQDQGKTFWDRTRIDLFFMDTAFHESMHKRSYTVDYGGSEIPILSAEDLVICKALTNRAKDWLDIDEVFQTQRKNLDAVYILHWLQYFLDGSDPIFAKLQTIAESAQ